MHLMDANKTAREEARRQSHKNAARNLEQSWRQHSTRHQLYGHLPPITKTIQVRRTRHAGHCWRSRDELISDLLLWTPTLGRAKAGRPARTYIQQLWEDTECSPEDLPEAMNDWEKCRERVRDIRASGTTWWWWWYKICYMIMYATKFVTIFRMFLWKGQWFWLSLWIASLLKVSVRVTVLVYKSSTADKWPVSCFTL